MSVSWELSKNWERENDRFVPVKKMTNAIGKKVLENGASIKIFEPKIRKENPVFSRFKPFLNFHDLHLIYTKKFVEIHLGRNNKAFWEAECER